MPTTIADIIRNPGPFTGVYRFCSSELRPTRAGWHYSRAVIADSTGTLTCNGWPRSFFPIPGLPPMIVVQVTGRTREFNRGIVADISAMTPAPALLTPETSLQLLPLAHCAVPAYLPRLLAVLGSIASPSLRAFVGAVFANDQIALPFLRVPASIGYHHPERGGLLVHTVEGIEFIAKISALSTEDRDYGLVGFTFHDVAKTVVYTETDYTAAGQLMSHDALTLELCAPALAALDRDWPAAALTLRHIWTCESSGSRYGFKSAIPITHLVRFVDNWSAERDKQQQAFLHQPTDSATQWRFRQRFWRPQSERV